MMALLSSGQERLFYSFNIEDHTPANHVLHSIDRCLNVKDLRHYLVEFIARPGLHLMTASFLPKPNLVSATKPMPTQSLEDSPHMIKSQDTDLRR